MGMRIVDTTVATTERMTMTSEQVNRWLNRLRELQADMVNQDFQGIFPQMSVHPERKAVWKLAEGLHAVINILEERHTQLG